MKKYGVNSAEEVQNVREVPFGRLGASETYKGIREMYCMFEV